MSWGSANEPKLRCFLVFEIVDQLRIVLLMPLAAVVFTQKALRLSKHHLHQGAAKVVVRLVVVEILVLVKDFHPSVQETQPEFSEKHILGSNTVRNVASDEVLALFRSDFAVHFEGLGCWQ